MQVYGWIVFWYLVLDVLLNGIKATASKKPDDRVIGFLSMALNGTILYYVWLTLQGP